MERALGFLLKWWVEIGAVVFAVIGVIDALMHPIGYDGVDKGEPEWLVVLLPALLVLPLVARRRYPFGAPLAVFLVAVVGSFVLTGEAVVDSGYGFLCLIVAALLLGGLDTRSAVMGLAAMYAAVFAVNSQGVGTVWGDYFFPSFFFTIFWAGARAHRLRGDRLHAAEAHAMSLAARREAEARVAVADERARIARELHDVVGHSVSVMTVQASAVRRLLLPEQEREREALLVVEETGRQALAEMRRMVGVLRRPEEAPTLAPQPSLERVDALVETARAAGLAVNVRIEGTARSLPPGIDLTGYRIVQEALTNVVKHAGATRAGVVVTFGESDVVIVVEDDGRGTANGDGDGHGLVGMRERVGVYGGDLETGPAPGGGYRLRARLPIA